MNSIALCSNEAEGTALASAAHVGNDCIVAYLLSVGVSANGSVEKCQLKVVVINPYSINIVTCVYRAHHYC